MKKIIYYFQKISTLLITKLPNWNDALFLSLFSLVIMLQPYYLYGKMNLFEWGIYLPGITSILKGNLPFRDFFYLRGPLEIYVPAFCMKIWGENTSILSTYFYVGTLFTFFICIFIGKEIYRSKLILSLMTLVLVARTFPRTVFTFWGGMRYALGLLSLLLFLYHFKKHKKIWIFLSAIICALSLLTSIDVGLCALFCFFITFFFNKIFIPKSELFQRKALLTYLAGLLIILIPYFFYLSFNHAFIPFIDCTLSVITNMYNTFPDHIVEYQPQNLIDALKAMIPSDPHFKHLTPAYCYLFFSGLIVFKLRKGLFSKQALPLIAVASYGLASYLFAFRKIGASNFEMALQPEKLILFYLLEETFFFLLAKKAQILSTSKETTIKRIQTNAKFKIYGIKALILLFIGSSVGYPIQRYNHRFFSFKYLMAILTKGDTHPLIPLANEPSQTLRIERAKGMHVPQNQANNVNQLVNFVNTHVAEDEPIFMFPELGSYNFLVNRPFIGRFPMVSFSWINDQWHQELMQDLRKKRPRYAVLSKDKSIKNLKVFFQIKRNKDKYDEVYNYIQQHYHLVSSTPDLNIYKINP